MEVMLMDKGHERMWSGMFAILIISIFFKGCYLLILGLSDKLLLRALLSLSMLQESIKRSKLFDGTT